MKEIAERDRMLERRAMLRRVSVIVYSTSWCPHCAEARAWLGRRSIAFDERDVERLPSARAEMARINPRGGVPTIAIDDEVLVGFSGAAIEAAIDRAIDRRLAR